MLRWNNFFHRTSGARSRGWTTKRVDRSALRNSGASDLQLVSCSFNASSYRCFSPPPRSVFLRCRGRESRPRSGTWRRRGDPTCVDSELWSGQWIWANDRVAGFIGLRPFEVSQFSLYRWGIQRLGGLLTSPCPGAPEVTWILLLMCKGVSSVAAKVVQVEG